MMSTRSAKQRTMMSTRSAMQRTTTVWTTT
jgi:hypothetical protein